MMIDGKNAMNKKNKTKANIKTFFVYVGYSLPVFIFILPIFLLVTRSFFSTQEITQVGAGLFPKDFHPETYRDVMDNKEFLNGLGNTMIVVVCQVVGTPLTALMSAYAFTKVKFYGRKLIFTMALGTIMIPGILLMLPVYKIFVNMGWYDTLLPLTIPCFFGGGIINVYMIMQFIRGIPKELDEAAYLDGAGILQKMFLVTLPNIKPIVMYVAVNSFFGAWNDIMGPLLYVQSEENYTVNLFIYRTYLTTTNILKTKPNEQMAIGVLLMIPMVVIFMFYQKALIEGMNFTGVKD